MLEDIYELAGYDNLTEGNMTMQICSMDGYRGEVQIETSEIYDYDYLLTFEIDQRTESGLEPNDTSLWEDLNYKFIAAEEHCRFRIYCNKGAASPAVFTETRGIVISTEGKKVPLGEQGENCSYTVKYINENGKEIKNHKTVYSCIPGMQVTEKSCPISNCSLSDDSMKSIILQQGNNVIQFKYTEKNYFYVKYTFHNKINISYYKLSELREQEIVKFETEEYFNNHWKWKSIFSGIRLKNLINIDLEINKYINIYLCTDEGILIELFDYEDYYILFSEIKKKAAGKLSYYTDYQVPSVSQKTIKSPKEVHGNIVGVVVNLK